MAGGNLCGLNNPVFGDVTATFEALGMAGCIETDLDGEYIVDSGHLLSYPKNIKLRIKMAGGIFSSFFSGEGLVLRLEGKGKIQLQTRSIGGVAGWLNPKFY